MFLPQESFACDSVISAVSITGIKAITNGSTALRELPEFAALDKLRAVDVVCVRLFLTKRLEKPPPHPSNGGFL